MDRPGVSASTRPIPSRGLTVLVNPEEPVLDIVFVHGFTGHPERTWAHKKGRAARQEEDDGASETSEPRSKVPGPDSFAKPSNHKRPGASETSERWWKLPRLDPSAKPSNHKRPVHYNPVYWPTDLLPHTIPNARVLTYGYDTHIRHRLGRPPSENTVYDIAWNFLVALEAERRSDASRPVLFVAHSLGGIVVREMLRRSGGCQISQTYLHGIFESTVGIVFFGTPHGGADPCGWLQQVAIALAKILGFSANKEVVDTLLPATDRLKELRDEFNPMAHQRGWAIHSFQEQYGLKCLGGKVVEDASSCLNYPQLETTEHIADDHRGMCRFPGLHDPEYKKVAAALRRITSHIPKRTAARECASLSEDQRKMLLESLRFDQIDARHTTIKKAHAETCKWLLNDPRYRDWLKVQGQGFFWIKGSPGTGKSTLIKHALADAKRTMKKRIIVGFFFNARGDTLEKSTEGMYRSLLLQLFNKVPELQSAFDSIDLISWKDADQHIWTVEILKELLEQAVKSLGKHQLTCFIDALDECDEEEIRDMIGFFEHLGKLANAASIRFDICFSSRHYPHITVNNEISLVLEGQAGHSLDIVNYINRELKIGNGERAKEIMDELLKKASGIFLWVVLVVQILNKEFDRGNVHKLRQKLRDIPAGLHELFRDILTRDHNNRDELLLCIQWVLFAKRPLTPKELYFAILSGIELGSLRLALSEEITAEVIRRFILNSSKGLVEDTKSKEPTVQFIHESVRDFLLKENGLGKIWSDIGSDFKAQSHERLKQCCAAYIDIDINYDIFPSNSLPKASSPEAAELRQSVRDKSPFLEYATRNVLYHADVAESYGFPEEDFIISFPLSRWIKLYNLFEKKEVRRYTQKAGLWYILAENNMAHLLRALARLYPKEDLIFGTTSERHGPPMLAALATGSQDAVYAIMKLEADRHPSDSPLHELYNIYSRSPNKRIKYGRDMKYRKPRDMLSYVIGNGDVTLLDFLLRLGTVELDIDRDGSCSLLLPAVQNGQEEAVRFLLEKGADPDFVDSDGRTPLSLAAKNGHTSGVKILLKTEGVNPDSRDNESRTPLSYAATQKHISVVEMLLRTKGVDPDSKDNRGRTPFFYASRGHISLVEVLLKTGGVNPDSRDNDGRTPLSYAVEYRNMTLTKLLLSTKQVDPDSRAINGRSPLSYTTDFEGTDIAELLLSTKQVDPDSRDDQGRTPLSYAAQRTCKDIVELLLFTKEVDLDSRAINGRSPLSYAAINDSIPIVELLLSTKQVDTDSRDNQGRTPLSYAAYLGRKDIVELLLSTKRVDPDSRDNEGKSPFDYAVGPPPFNCPAERIASWKAIQELLESVSRFKRRELLDGSVELVRKEDSVNA
ncbi:hypothetical protein FQN54_007573 [Arachnomyces sp. PD_36]|nr:hypothetical protein FQN54_007573 [Arachnomyces sp. PD_36]